MEIGAADLDGLTRSQRLKVRGERGRGWHLRLVEQGGDHRDVAPERCGDLEAHEVVGILQPRPALRVRLAQPAPADQRDQDVAACESLVDHAGKAAAGLDRVDVAKDTVTTEVLREAVVKATRVAAGVLAAVADEDATHAQN